MLITHTLEKGMLSNQVTYSLNYPLHKLSTKKWTSLLRVSQIILVPTCLTMKIHVNANKA